jgi:transposase
MLTVSKETQIFLASQPIDFRMSINSLSTLVQKEIQNYIHDGSIYVFYNKNKDKIKCLFWDKNGFVLYYKKLENIKFKFNTFSNNIEALTFEQLQALLSASEPVARPALEDLRKKYGINTKKEE